jgi:hypothetical protein
MAERRQRPDLPAPAEPGEIAPDLDAQIVDFAALQASRDERWRREARTSLAA